MFLCFGLLLVLGVGLGLGRCLFCFLLWFWFLGLCWFSVFGLRVEYGGVFV